MYVHVYGTLYVHTVYTYKRGNDMHMSTNETVTNMIKETLSIPNKLCLYALPAQAPQPWLCSPSIRAAYDRLWTVPTHT